MTDKTTTKLEEDNKKAFELGKSYVRDVVHKATQAALNEVAQALDVGSCDLTLAHRCVGGKKTFIAIGKALMALQRQSSVSSHE